MTQSPETPGRVRSAPNADSQAPRTMAIQPWRLAVVIVFVAVVLARIVVQLVNIQVFSRDEYVRKADGLIEFETTIDAKRGEIRDRFGNVLALDIERKNLYLDLTKIQPDDMVRLAEILESWIDIPAEEILAKMNDNRGSKVLLARWLEPEVAEKIKLLKDSGLILEEDTRRYYPQGTFAAHVIGAKNLTEGISGIEYGYNDVLAGTAGQVNAEITKLGTPIWSRSYTRTEPVAGGTVELTIDPFIQHIAERELTQAVEQHVATGGTIIVLDVRTGAVRAMTSLPVFDPNTYYDYDPEIYYNNPAVNSQYEPGSTFKILTVAAGLQANSFDESTTVNDEGSIQRYDYNIKNFDKRGNGLITPAKVLYYSSNIGAILFGEMMGESIFYRSIEGFGFGTVTGIELPAEVPGTIKKPGVEGYSPVDFSTNTFGQGISVTPLQLVRMAATVANDGVMMRPYIVQRVCTSDGVCTTTEPREQGRPISPEIAQKVRKMLVLSANHYANTIPPDDLWLVPGFEVGAKTGTSSIPDLINGGYEDRTIGSVVGMAPINAPRYAVLVKIDRPSDDIWGVRTALPVYRQVVAELMRYDRVAPDSSMVGDGQRAGVVNDS